MKVITKVVIDISSGAVLEEFSYEYTGPVAYAKGTPQPVPMTAAEQEAQQLQLEALRRSAKLEEDMEPFILQSMRLKRDEEGNLVKMTEEEFKESLGVADLQAYENLLLSQERQSRALRGELPLTEAGQQRKMEEFASFKERMARSGHVIEGDDPESATAETTSGIQGLKAFNQRYGLLEEAERYGELNRGTSAIMQRMGVASDIGTRRTGGMLDFPTGPLRRSQAAAGLLRPHYYQPQNATGDIMAMAGTLGAAGIMAISARKYKKQIAPTTAKESKEALEMVKGLDTYSYRYKWEGEEGPPRLGLMADEAPRAVVTPDREGLDVGRMLGLLTVATKALARKVEQRRRV